MVKEWSTGISAGCVSEPQGHRPVRSLPDPKANILIDNVGHARLSGFGLLAIVSDRSAIPSSVITGSPVRWMSPELLSPEKFGLKGGHPTKESDCYSLGMVIYEVLSDLIPYSLYNHITVVQKILDGERPAKPGGAKGEWFTGGLWETLGLCWKPKPNDRPTLRAVLRCLEDGTRPSHTSLDVGRDMNAKSDATASLVRLFPLHAGPTLNFPADRTTNNDEVASKPPMNERKDRSWIDDRSIRNTLKTFKVITCVLLRARRARSCRAAVYTSVSL